MFQNDRDEIFRYQIKAPLKQLDKALKLAFSDNFAKDDVGAVGFRVDQLEHGPRLIFFWTPHDSMTVFLHRFNASDLTEMVHTWCRNNAPTTEGIHTDGSIGVGFRLYNERWGHVDGLWEAFCAIEPALIIYGK